MLATDKSHLQDVAILTQAVENVFRKLTRFLVGRISLIKLQEMIRTIFIEEAECQLRQKYPKKNVSLSQLALMSGLDTRTLIKIRNGSNYRKPFHEAASFLKEFTPGVAILDLWSSKPPYYDPKKGKPITLKINGEAPSFESLFSECVKSRGITSNSVLQSLVESGSIRINENDGTVSLKQLSYLPTRMSDQIDSIAVGFSAIGSLIDTVVHNVTSENSDLFYQRGLWTYRLPYRNRQKVRKELKKILEDNYQTAQTLLGRYEMPEERTNQLTSGIGLFYFEEHN